MRQEDALKQWYQSQLAQEPKQGKTQEYTRAQQLFDAAQWEAEYGDDDKKQWFFALCERLLQIMGK